MNLYTLGFFVPRGNVIFVVRNAIYKMEMATKFFIVSFERDSKIIYRSVLLNFYICFTLGDIVT